MMSLVHALFGFVRSGIRSRIGLQIEIVALRHQLAMYKRSIRRPQIRPPDRILWAWLARQWGRWREVLVFVQPATVVAWQRRRFQDHWTRLSQTRPGRPRVSPALRTLIRNISTANPHWGGRASWGNCGRLG
jgi:hypothetical protein